MPTTCFTPAEARRDFLKICRKVISNKEKVYIKDKNGKRYMTLDATEHHLAFRPIPVTAQKFKDHFSRLSSLIKTGFCFQLSLRGSTDILYARQHTEYRDPLEDLLASWRRENEAKAAAAAADLLREREFDENRELLLKIYKGVARIGIGHFPFREGRLPPGSTPDSRDDDE